MNQNEALEIMISGANVFITGPAGSGKTFVLNRYIEYLRQNNVDVAVTASTGIAATHLGGITIHSWTGMGVRESIDEKDLKMLLKRGYLVGRYRRVKVLIIDEISMLHGFQLDLADMLFRAFKKNNQPFGGIQVILCGDFFQLPPVSHLRDHIAPQNQDKYDRQQEIFDSGAFGRKTKFAIGSRAWQNLDLKICYLNEQHRQRDKKFLSLLNDIRRGKAGAAVCDCLQSRVDAKIELPAEPTKLYCYNADVDFENIRHLSTLGGKEFCYPMEGLGPQALLESLQKGCLAPQVLRLKAGAKVMFVKNNFEEGYVNGTLGKVEKLDESRIIVRTAEGKIDVGLASWRVIENGKIRAEINQYPLRLAWAITVHKSQGMSLDAAIVDLAQSFEPGMGYVALSRVRGLQGLSLTGFNEMALKVSDQILEFDKTLLRASRSFHDKLIKKRHNGNMMP